MSLTRERESRRRACFFGGNSGPISWSFVSITLRLFSRPLLYLLCVLVRTLMLTSLAVSYFSLYVFYSVPRWRLFLFLDGGWVLLGPCLLVVVVVFIFFGLFEGDKKRKGPSPVWHHPTVHCGTYQIESSILRLLPIRLICFSHRHHLGSDPTWGSLLADF